MNTINMPGFTADASFYKRSGFGMAAITVSKNTTESVQPAVIYGCYDIGQLWDQARHNGDAGLTAFWAGFYVGFGCTR